MKIFFIAPANNIHTIRWVNALSKYYEIHLISCKNHIGSIDKISNKVIIHKLKVNSPIGYYLNAIELRKLFKEIRPDMINIHYASGYGTLVRISKINPVLLSVWGSDIYEFPNKSKLNKRILQKNVMNADYLASTSNAMANELKKQVPMLKKEIFITPFGVDVEKFKNLKLEKDEKYFNIGMIKTLEKNYGVDYSILAVKNLKDRLIKNKENDLANSVKLYIYGEGKERKNLEKLVVDNNLQETVFIKGRIPNENVPSILNKFDVVCITSLSESFGVAVVEAMACEVPVVATKVDGFKEVMEDKKTGILVESKNVEDISKALEELLRNEKDRIKYGKNGRKRVMENYNWKENVEYMNLIYKKIINNK